LSAGTADIRIDF